MRISQHANERMRQRGFREEFLDFLLMYGKYEYAKRSATKVFITKKMLKALLGSKQITDQVKMFIKKYFDKISRKVLIIDTELITAYNTY